jgi:hypothetical protein
VKHNSSGTKDARLNLTQRCLLDHLVAGKPERAYIWKIMGFLSYDKLVTVESRLAHNKIMNNESCMIINLAQWTH